MNIRVRFGAGLVQSGGISRLTVTLAEQATVADLMEQLRTQYPDLEQRLNIAIPIIAGRYVTHSDRLTAGQEVALLLPVSGGC